MCWHGQQSCSLGISILYPVMPCLLQSLILAQLLHLSLWLDPMAFTDGRGARLLPDLISLCLPLTPLLSISGDHLYPRSRNLGPVGLQQDGGGKEGHPDRCPSISRIFNWIQGYIWNSLLRKQIHCWKPNVFICSQDYSYRFIAPIIDISTFISVSCSAEFKRKAVYEWR